MSIPARTTTRRIADGTTMLAPKPANLTFAQAAAVPVSALTALQAVRDRGRVQAGQQVLVIICSRFWRPGRQYWLWTGIRAVQWRR